MSKKYCTECGSPNAPLSNFCGECGHSFKGAVAAKPTKKVPKYEEPENEDEEDEDIEIPEINKLKYKVEKARGGGMELADILGKGGVVGNDFKRPTPNLKVKDILEKGKNSGKIINIGSDSDTDND